ncbi:MAG: ABC transporter ATP-binding protein [Lachnospiraceae bacterium]|nr:ABC transporter ATP-binding protein [Lachnospiraceae bacterium]
MSEENMELLSLKNISKYYGKKQQIKALDGFSAIVQEKEMLALMGKSGSGKSTILNIISGIDLTDSGNYVFEKEDITRKKGDAMTLFRRKNIGIVMQHFALVEDMDCFENIALPLRLEKVNKREIYNRVGEVANKLGIADKLKKLPRELSGGEAQRVAIARAIINKPKLILADEPTGALDEENSLKIMEIFKQLNDEGITLIVVTHDPEVAAKCRRTIWIKDGKNVDEL